MQDLASSLGHLRSLTGFSAYDEEVLRQAAPTLLGWRKDLVAEILSALTAHAPAAEILARLEPDRDVLTAALERGYERTVSGPHDDGYWRELWDTGRLQIHAGLEISFVLGAIGRLQAALLPRIQAAFEAQSALLVGQALLRLTNMIGGVLTEAYHQGYLDALARVGLRRTLVHRLVDIDVTSKTESMS